MTAIDRLNDFSDEINAARDTVLKALDACSTHSTSAERRAVANAYHNLAAVYDSAGKAVCTEDDGALISTVLIDAQSSARQRGREWDYLANTAAAREARTTSKSERES